MYTYIMKSHDLHKIGRAIDVDNRLKGFLTGNPYIELVKTIDGNHEKKLHTLFKDKRVKGEWFNLSQEDIDSIDAVVRKPVKISVDIRNKLLEYLKIAQNHVEIIELSPIIRDNLAIEWSVTTHEIKDTIVELVKEGALLSVGMYMYKRPTAVTHTKREISRPVVKLEYNDELQCWVHHKIVYTD